MRCVIPQITWNSQQQILSLDFDPSCKGENGFYRLVTVGADTNLLIWQLRKPDTLKPELKFSAELIRHQKAVNVVRFSPDGNYIASGDDDAYIIIWKKGSAEGEDVWTVEKSLRKHLGDVTDLAWSADSNYLISSSVDNSAVCWDVKKGSVKFLSTDHSGFVQGASYDPLGEVAATICNDRTLRLFDTTTGKLKSKVCKYNSDWVKKFAPVDETEVVVTSSSPPPSTNGNDQDQQEVASSSKKGTATVSHHMFQDDSLATFCRRLSFSPGGEFLIVPGGCVPSPDKVLASNNKKNSDEEVAGESSKKRIKTKTADKTTSDDHAVILFCRNDFTVPCAVIPTKTSYSIAARFCPIYFNRDKNSFSYDKDLLNPVRKDDRRIYCTGKLQTSTEEESKELLLDTPYRAVYAVATNNTVMIGATDKPEPLAVVRNIHFARLTDLSWSPDGRVLVTTSTDGYCSIITFDENELGVPFKDEIPALLDPAKLPIPVKEVKETKSKKSTGAKKSETPKAQKSTPTTKSKTPTTKTKTLKAKPAKVSKTTLDTPERQDSGKKSGQRQIKLFTNGSSSKEDKTSSVVELPSSSNESLPLGELAEINGDDDEMVPMKQEPIQKNTLDKWLMKKNKQPDATAADDNVPPPPPSSEISITKEVVLESPPKPKSRRVPLITLSSTIPPTSFPEPKNDN